MSQLAQLTDVKAFILPTPPAGDDTLLTRLIQAASDYIETFLNRSLLTAAYTDTLSGIGARRMTLPNYPITAVASLFIDGVAIPQSTNPAVVGWVQISPFTIALRGGYVFTQGYGNITVSYTAGLATIPNEITQACIELVARRYKTRDRIGVSSKGLGGEQIVFDVADFTDNIRETLLQYKRVMTA